MFRVKGVSWWPVELPSEEVHEAAVRNLEKANWQMNCVLTHCLSTGVMMKLSLLSPECVTAKLRRLSTP